MAGVALQAQCASASAGVATCPDPSDPLVVGSTEPEPPVLEAVAATIVHEPAPAADAPSGREVALKSAGGLIAGTFDMLIDMERSDDAAPSDAEVAAVAAVESAATEAGGGGAETTPALALAKRSVTSVPVGSDGQPVWSFAGQRRPEAVSAASAAAAEVGGSVAGGTPANAVARSAPAAPWQVEPLAFAAASGAVAPRPQTRPETLASASAASGPVRVGDSSVNVRAGPSGSSPRLFALAAGAEVRTTHAESGWARIVDAQDRVGWVFATYLVGADLDGLPGADDAEPIEVAAAAAPAAASGDVRTVRGQGVNVRATPSSSGGKLFALRGGVRVTVTDNERGWLRITDPDGRSGWVYSRYLSGG